MNFIFSDPAVDFYYALAGELRRREALARIFYDTGPGRTRAALAGILAHARSRGELAFDDAEQAAEHLFGLWQGFSNLQLALGVEIVASEKGWRRVLRQASTSSCGPTDRLSRDMPTRA